MFNSLVSEPVHLTKRQPDTGLVVVDRTSHVDQTGYIKLQTQDPSEHSPRISFHVPQERTRSVQDYTEEEATIVRPHVENQVLPQPLVDVHPILIQIPVAPVCQKSQTSPVTEENESSSPSHTLKLHKSRIREQPNTVQSNKTSVQPQSMARSRLEKARCRLQGRIQQAIKLFGGREISEPQAKKKQVNF